MRHDLPPIAGIGGEGLGSLGVRPAEHLAADLVGSCLGSVDVSQRDGLLQRRRIGAAGDDSNRAALVAHFVTVAGNAAIAFSEEFFYRGYMTARFEERWGPVRSALAAAALFALGHLIQPAPWRVMVFFPALLFAFLRNRTRTIVGASIAHWMCNVWLLVLEA